MRRVTVERREVNIEALDTGLRAAIGKSYLGTSTQPGQVHIHLADDVSGPTLAQARQLAEEHDPTRLTTEQQARINRAQKLQSARLENSEPLFIEDYDFADTIVRNLALKIAWLEEEIRDLRAL